MVVLKIALLLFCATTIHGTDKVTCDFNDKACTTKSADAGWSIEVSGEAGKWNSSDPILLKTIEGQTEAVKYKFEKANLTGLAGCKVSELSINTEEKKMDYVLSCAELYAEAVFDMSGTIGDKKIDGAGTVTATRYQYVITVNSTYTTSAGDDGKTYMDMTEFTISFLCNENVTYTLDFTEDRGSSEDIVEAVNADWATTENVVGEPSMKGFMEYCVQNSNDYLKQVPMEEMFYEI